MLIEPFDGEGEGDDDEIIWSWNIFGLGGGVELTLSLGPRMLFTRWRFGGRAGGLMFRFGDDGGEAILILDGDRLEEMKN